MGKSYNFDDLRELSLFAPDVRFQQVTVAAEPNQINWIGPNGGGREAEVIFVLRRAPDEVLLINRTVYPENIYRLPTGGIEAGETPQEAAIREIYEETGYRVDSAGLLGVVAYTMHWPGLSETDFVSYVFTAEVTTDQPPRSLEGEVDAYRWVPSTALDNVAVDLRNLPADWAYWGRFRAVSYEFIHCGIMQYNRDVGNRLVAGR